MRRGNSSTPPAWLRHPSHDGSTIADAIGKVKKRAPLATLLLLRQPLYHQATRYGYVRENETVRYVREVVQRFDLLKRMVSNSRSDRVVMNRGDTEASINQPTGMGIPGLD
jgi:hypothetical protein